MPLLVCGWTAAATSVYADELTVEELAAARKVYVAKCAKCHRFYEPKNYSEPAWRTWREKMDRKSKLKTEQADLLRRYLDAYRTGRLPGKPEDAAKAGRKAAR
jgi:cytochrome c553